jgi:hypothetical protein
MRHSLSFWPMAQWVIRPGDPPPVALRLATQMFGWPYHLTLKKKRIPFSLSLPLGNLKKANALFAIPAAIY